MDAPDICCSQIGNLIVAGLNMRDSVFAATGPTEPHTHLAVNPRLHRQFEGKPWAAFLSAILKSDVESMKISGSV